MSKQLRLIIISYLVFLAALCFFYRNIARTSFDGDESGWISTASYYTKLLERGSLDMEAWKCSECDTFGGDYNLHLGQWLLGIPLELYYARNNLKFFNMYDYGAGGKLTDFAGIYRINKKMGKVPPYEILLPARAVSAIFGAMCCVAVFLIGYYSLNLWVGLIAAGFLMWNRIFTLYAAQAMTDVYFNFFLLCAYLAIVRFKVPIPKASSRTLSLIVGIFAGLATSVKITGIVIIGLILAGFLMYVYFIRYKPYKGILLDLAIFFCVAVAVVYLLNPYFWDLRHPLRFFQMFLARNDILNTQVRIYGDHFHGQSRFLAASLNVLEYYSYRPHYPLLYYFFAAIFCCGALAVNGIIFVKSLFKRVFNPRVVIFLFFLINYLFILQFLKMSWARYYLPAVIAAGLITAIFIYDGLLFFFRMAAKVKSRYIRGGCKAKEL